MFALVYASTETQPFGESSLRQLAIRAAENNKRLEITGYLHYHQGTFLQYLEGEWLAVTQLYKTIALDHRHQIVRCVELGSRPQRLFPDWSMKYLGQLSRQLFSVENSLQGVLTSIVYPEPKPAELRLQVEQLVVEIARSKDATPL